MADIRLVKLVTGEFCVGTDDEEFHGIKDVALLQFNQNENGININLVAYGFPFEQEFGGFIYNDNIVYEIENLPEDLKVKYTEALSSMKSLKSGGSKILGSN